MYISDILTERGRCAEGTTDERQIRAVVSFHSVAEPTHLAMASDAAAAAAASHNLRRFISTISGSVAEVRGLRTELESAPVLADVA